MHKLHNWNFFLFLFFLLLFLDRLLHLLTVLCPFLVRTFFPFLFLLLRQRNNVFLLLSLLCDFDASLRCHPFLKEIKDKLRVGLFKIFVFVVSCWGSFLRNGQKDQRHCIFSQLRCGFHLKYLQYARLIAFELLFHKHQIMSGPWQLHNLKSGNNAGSYMQVELKFVFKSSKRLPSHPSATIYSLRFA